MFFNGPLFWFLNGIIFVVIVFALKVFAEDKGWSMPWWKWLLSGIWYLIFCTGFYAWGTLIGENFPAAGFRFFLFDMVISLILGVGLWRILAHKPQSVEPEPAE
jgi:hypothetical protein